METYVADAHALVWYLTGDSRISKRVGQIFEQAEDATVQVLIPTIVLAEITHIAQRKKVKVTIDEVLKRIEIGSGFPHPPSPPVHQLQTTNHQPPPPAHLISK